MSRSQGRTFSFDDDDETSLDALHANRHSYQAQADSPSGDVNPFPLPVYTDSPTRHYDTPPPPPAHQAISLPAHQSFDPTNSNPSSPRPRVRINTTQAQNAPYESRGLDHSTSTRTASTITPGADNMGEAAGGGIAGIAYGIANTNERESGVEAMRSLEHIPRSGRGLPPERDYDTLGTTTPYVPAPPPSNRGSYGGDPFSSPAPSGRSNPFDSRRNSDIPSLGDLTPRADRRSQYSIPMAEYPSQDVHDNGRGSFTDNPYKRFSTAWDPRVARGDINPDEIEDEPDENIAPPLRSRRSFMGLGNQSDRGPHGSALDGVAGAAATGGVLGALGGLVGRDNNVPHGARDPSGQYGPVPGSSSGPGIEDGAIEKSPWLSKQTSGRRKSRWIIGILGFLIIVGAIVGGVVGGLHNSRSNTSSDNASTPSNTKSDSDLNADSPEIKRLMNNPKFHKVFPGMDYTPFNAQYPACLTNPPSQDNVTMDVAVLSQLTNTIRLYGTDCNQTEMVLHAIDKLALPHIKVWLGVWLDKNSTTNDRGLSAMYNILAKAGASPFAGVIIGNEVLYRKDMTETQLGTILSGVRQNLTSQKINIPVATSDLGDDWTPDLAKDTDFVMSNIHPFFAGVAADVAAGWTWNFWQEKDTVLVTDQTKNVISETGWPSTGGTDCGEATTTTCSPGSVAGISEMNTFMDNFICQSLANGTNFFW